MIINDQNTSIHFGALGYENYTKHRDKDRRERYLTRATKIKGNWINDKFSPNTQNATILSLEQVPGDKNATILFWSKNY
jgi:hypothetical protein